jgi:signal transduction histidine kinase
MEETLRSKTLSNKFINGLSFELRTLLNGFSGPVQLLKVIVENPELAEIFRMFDSTLSRLERLTMRSEIVLSIDSDQYQLSKTDVNIVDIARYSIIEMQSITDLENVKIIIPQQPANITIHGNFDYLIQVFNVLLETAVSLSEENSQINVDFFNSDNEVKCLIYSNTASLPFDWNSSLEQLESSDNAPWDVFMVKKILALQNADISVVNTNGQAHSFEILFKKP